MARLAAGLTEAFAAGGLRAQVPVFGTLFSIFFSDEPVRDYQGAVRAAASGLYAPFFRAMLSRGVALAPSPYEIAFTSLAHSSRDIDRTIETAADVARELNEEAVSRRELGGGNLDS